MSSKKLKPVDARVDGFVVLLTMSDGSTIERDFVLVSGPAFKRWKRATGIDPRVRLGDGEIYWPGDIDFSLDTVVWGDPNEKRRRPLKRAAVVPGGLMPAPWVRDVI
jgi:hypothetical protein